MSQLLQFKMVGLLLGLRLHFILQIADGSFHQGDGEIGNGIPGNTKRAQDAVVLEI